MTPVKLVITKSTPTTLHTLLSLNVFSYMADLYPYILFCNLFILFLEITIAKEFLVTVNFRHTGQEYIYLLNNCKRRKNFQDTNQANMGGCSLKEKSRVTSRSYTLPFGI